MKAKNLMVPIQNYLKPETTLREAVNPLRVARREGEKKGKGLRECPSWTGTERLSGCWQ